jgi:multiple sugar transport system substrate-binding protein
LAIFAKMRSHRSTSDKNLRVLVIQGGMAMKKWVIACVLSLAILPATVQAEEIPIRVMTPNGLLFVRIGTDMFNKQYMGKYRAELDIIAFDHMFEKQMTQFLSRSAAYDVLAVHSSWIQTVSRHLEPLNRYVEERGPKLVDLYGAGAVNTIRVKNNIMGLPFRGPGTNILFYRKDLFEEAGLKPPTTPDEVLHAARKLTKKRPDGQVERYGYSYMALAPYWSVATIADHLFSRGVYFLTEDYQDANPALKGDVAVATLEYLKRFLDEGLIPNPLGWGTEEDQVSIKEGRIAMTMQSSAKAGFMEVEKDSRVAGKMGYVPGPFVALGPDAPKMFGFVWMYSIDRNSKKKDAAYEYVKFMAGEEAQRAMAVQGGNEPSPMGILVSPEYRKINPGATAVAKVRYEIGTRTPLAVPENPTLAKAVHEEFHLFLLGKQNARDTVTKMYERIRKILKKT